MPERADEPLSDCPQCGYPTDRLMHVLGCEHEPVDRDRLRENIRLALAWTDNE